MLTRLQNTDAGVMAHETACNTLETMICYDQLDVSNIASAELMAREVQIVEEKWKDKILGSDTEDRQIFLGDSRSRGVCVCPLLQEWVAEELKKEALITKERRKAREERNLARNKPGKDGK